MKKFILGFIIFINCFGIGYANQNNIDNGAKNNQEGSTHIKSVVSTKIPGVKCEQKGKLYECEIPKSSKGVIGMLGQILKWFTFLTSLGSVLVIAICGIMYSMGGVNEELKSSAKKWIIQIIIGIIILFSSGYILQIIAPWIYG